ncbi:hypothetical protein AUR64_07940 [Haloprofundus marisrubri]|uniref:Uncharacterized protein n=1 Tax=Haloprofundus marisrubri TaxID=1514971 RepID=A0A0W1RAN1_9EURY|nr:hypothetical protein [Haloprofundus marisrubri]KTG10591.1 hypothetical protein AUR64_07940 [Haloprofundus marisrubri]
MSVFDNPAETGELPLLERVQHLAAQANPAFAGGSILVPLLFVAVSVATNSVELLFYTHVAAGAVWFAFALIFPAVIGPVLGGLDPEVSQEVTAKLTPKSVFFLFGFSLTTVLSGTLLLTGMGLGYGFSSFWPTAALTAGWGLFLFGLLVPHRLHLRAYYEGSRERPDTELLALLGKRLPVIGVFEAVVMLGIIFIMTGMRLGI